MKTGGAILYFAAALILYLLSLPFLILLSFKSKYNRSVPARFFLKNNPAFANPGVWFHACSLGEAKSLEPLIERFAGENVNVSVITQTGYEAAKKLPADVRYLPFETFLPFWVRDNKALIVLEAELWFLLFFLARRRGMKTILLNARMSDRSFGRYRKIRWFYSRIFANIDVVYAQSQTDRNRLLELGARHVEVIGNIKMFQKVTYKGLFVKPEGLTVTAASTHEGEEGVIVDGWLRYGKGRIIVVPRHPERFEKVARLLAQKAETAGKSFHRLSEREDFASDIVLVDKMGVLVEIYAIADVVILGGSFVRVGGHNPLEPAHFGCRLITGHEIFNQHAIFDGLENVIYTHKEGLADALAEAEQTPGIRIKHRPDIDHLFEKIKSNVL
jgi:3-deoxy-D-manno-octulosonic-acid transferase